MAGAVSPEWTMAQAPAGGYARPPAAPTAMETSQIHRPPPIYGRHVRRPRLTRLLDAASAQTILFTAPAGYGKTTLACEWLQGNEHVAWYRATEASADVAALSVGLADAVAHFMPGAGDRLRKRVRMGDAPERIVRSLAELFAEDLEDWPADAWMVIDDYHLAMRSKPTEEFVDWLLALAPVRLLATTRQRPTWATSRRALNGDFYELRRDQLAMTPSEAAEVLASQPAASAKSLIEKAEGWPALLGLATLWTASDLPESVVAESLFSYLAEEILDNEPPEIQRFLLIAAIPSSFDVAFARDVIRAVDPEETLDYLSARGLLLGDMLSAGFHPLLRESLLRRGRVRMSPAERVQIFESCVTHARAHGQWDDALRIADNLRRPPLTADILEEASSSLLAEGQVETILAWLERVASEVDGRPDLLLIRCESLIRLGRFEETVGVARRVASATNTRNRAARAYLVAAQAHFFASDPQRALEACDLARSALPDGTDLKAVLWRRFVSARELNLPDLSDFLAPFEEAAGTSLDDRLRVASGHVHLGYVNGSYAGLWRRLRPLLGESVDHSDPIAVVGALLNICYVAIGRGDYGRANALADQLTSLCQKHRVDFGVGFCIAARSHAELGLGNIRRSEALLEELRGIAAQHEDPYLSVAYHTQEARLSISRGDLEIRPLACWESAGTTLPLDAANYLSLEAIAAAACGERKRSEQLIERSLAIAATIETICNTQWAALINDLHEQPDGLASRAVGLVQAQQRREFLDSFVLACRATPELLPLLSANRRAASIALSVLGRGRDRARARRAGILTSAEAGRGSGVLTPREQEVWELMAGGYTNADIARRLFISISTAKVHVRHILKKLGARNRLEAALAFTRELED
jgi:LuxR family transcriptional regulator, maltose regulon positive regulatory protein